MQANIPCGILYGQDHVGNQLLGLNFPTNLCKRKSLNLRNHKKIMNNDESYITLILLDRNELEIIIMEGIREWLRLNLEMC